MLRILLVPLVVVFLLCKGMDYHYLYAGIVFLIASYTDYLDGKLARKRNLITNFGQIMDPLADKILINSILICFVSSDLVPAMAAVIMIAREFIITSVRFLILQNNGKVVPANIFGKLKTVSQMVAIVSIFAFQTYIEISSKSLWLPIIDKGIFLLLQNILIWISVLMSCISGVIYIYSGRKCITLDS